MAVKCICIEKFRDKQGNIKGYRLQDAQGKCLNITSENLKIEIFAKRFNVVNLKLTSDGRLIDKEVAVPNEKSTKEKAFNELLKLINSNYEPDCTASEEEFTESTERKAVKLLRELGVNIKRLPELNYGERFWDYCCGRVQMEFRKTSGIGIEPYFDDYYVEEYIEGKEYYSANKLKKLIDWLTSKENTECIQFYDLYTTIINASNRLINKYKLANTYRISMYWDGDAGITITKGDSHDWLDEIEEALLIISVPDYNCNIKEAELYQINMWYLDVDIQKNKRTVNKRTIAVSKIKADTKASKQDLYNLLYNQIEQALKKVLAMQ